MIRELMVIGWRCSVSHGAMARTMPPMRGLWLALRDARADLELREGLNG